MKPGDRILVDTMIIIEAHRMRCWTALASAYRVETVDMCVVECATGRHHRRDFQPVDDAGERELLAFAQTQRDAWLVCTSAKAALGCLHRLGLLERTVSLERMAQAAGQRLNDLPLNFSEKWLGTWRTKFLLGELP